MTLFPTLLEIRDKNSIKYYQTHKIKDFPEGFRQIKENSIIQEDSLEHNLFSNIEPSKKKPPDYKEKVLRIIQFTNLQISKAEYYLEANNYNVENAIIKIIHLDPILLHFFSYVGFELGRILAVMAGIIKDNSHNERMISEDELLNTKLKDDFPRLLFHLTASNVDENIRPFIEKNPFLEENREKLFANIPIDEAQLLLEEQMRLQLNEKFIGKRLFEILEGKITRLEEYKKKQHFSFFVCGLVKAGKSSFINTICHQRILHNEDGEATCGIYVVRHIKNAEPSIYKINDIDEIPQGKPECQGVGNVFDFTLEENQKNSQELNSKKEQFLLNYPIYLITIDIKFISIHKELSGLPIQFIDFMGLCSKDNHYLSFKKFEEILRYKSITGII